MLSTKYKSVSAVLLVEGLDVAGLLEFLGVCPVGFLLLHLAVGIAAALQRLQRLLQGLGHISVVDHAPPQIDDLVDVLDQQRAFLLASTAGRARPDFILGINAADQRPVPAIVRAAQEPDSAGSCSLCALMVRNRGDNGLPTALAGTIV